MTRLQNQPATTTPVKLCPRCGSDASKELARLRPEQEHLVLRCRSCGHLWSPKWRCGAATVSSRSW